MNGLLVCVFVLLIGCVEANEVMIDAEGSDDIDDHGVLVEEGGGGRNYNLPVDTHSLDLLRAMTSEMDEIDWIYLDDPANACIGNFIAVKCWLIAKFTRNRCWQTVQRLNPGDVLLTISRIASEFNRGRGDLALDSMERFLRQPYWWENPQKCTWIPVFVLAIVTTPISDADLELLDSMIDQQCGVTGITATLLSKPFVTAQILLSSTFLGGSWYSFSEIFPTLKVHDGILVNNAFDILEMQKNSKIVLLDIGANSGSFSMLALGMSNASDFRVYSFEPNPIIYKRLVKHIEMNQLKDRVFPVPIALSSSKGNMSMVLHEQVKTTGLASVTRDSLGKRGPVIAAMTLDEWMREYGEDLSITMIKLDVEGHEEEVLWGGKETILKHKPLMLLEKNDFSNVKRLLMEYGYVETRTFLNDAIFEYKRGDQT